MSSTINNQAIAASVNQWLDDVVIGLNLCPFAAKPQRNKQIKIQVSNATREEDLLQDILDQLLELDSKQPDELETTLVVVPDMLHDFTDYNFFIDWVEALIRQENWEGIYQVATFHPDYCFAGSEPEDAENLTNRAPTRSFTSFVKRVWKRFSSTIQTRKISPTSISNGSPT